MNACPLSFLKFCWAHLFLLLSTLYILVWFGARRGSLAFLLFLTSYCCCSCYRNALDELWRSRLTQRMSSLFLSFPHGAVWAKRHVSCVSLLAPVAVGQLRDSRGCKSAPIHPLQSLPTALPGAETWPCKRSLFWQTHPLYLHGTPYEAPGDEVGIISTPRLSIYVTFYPLTSFRFFLFYCRGNSKYHYYGIRVKPDSPLNRLQEDMQYMALRQQPVQQKQRCTRRTWGRERDDL